MPALSVSSFSVKYSQPLLWDPIIFTTATARMNENISRFTAEGQKFRCVAPQTGTAAAPEYVYKASVGYIILRIACGSVLNVRMQHCVLSLMAHPSRKSRRPAFQMWKKWRLYLESVSICVPECCSWRVLICLRSTQAQTDSPWSHTICREWHSFAYLRKSS